MRPSPALVIAVIALFAVLGGTVYAAKHKQINGKLVKPNSMPGNRLKPRSVAANRLKPGILPSPQNPITGAEINEATLGPVPNAISAEVADRAISALDAQTALNAVNAINATKVNGHEVGCLPSTQVFAGACWQSSASTGAVTAPTAAAVCAEAGGELPEALQLAAFAKQPGVNLDAGKEWSSDIPVVSGVDVYAVVTVSPTGQIDTAASTSSKHFRCVLPLIK